MMVVNYLIGIFLYALIVHRPIFDVCKVSYIFSKQISKSYIKIIYVAIIQQLYRPLMFSSRYVEYCRIYYLATIQVINILLKKLWLYQYYDIQYERLLIDIMVILPSVEISIPKAFPDTYTTKKNHLVVKVICPVQTVIEMLQVWRRQVYHVSVRLCIDRAQSFVGGI